MIGTTVGSYRITEQVSVGGMGTVYKAEHTLIGKDAAVKILHPELRNNRDVVQRFFNEAKATSQIKHPGIVEMFDFGYLDNGDGYIVMEFLDGMSLARRLARAGKMHEGESALILRSVCGALAAAHAKNIVHRDLKPDNIFLCPDPESPTGERPKILDFGIAKLNVGNPTDKNATQAGQVMGTPTYMSPEQCKGTGQIDLRADLYSLGCIFFEMVAGRPPFIEEGAGELLGAHLYLPPKKPTEVGASISREAEDLIMELLQKDPVKRVQTAPDLAKRLGEIAKHAGLVARATPPSLVEYATELMSAPTLPSDPGSSTGAKTATPEPSDPDLAQFKPKPTTLSGAASQQSVSRRSRGSRIGIAVGILAFAMVIGAGLTMALRGKKAKPTMQPAKTPVEEPVAAQPPPLPPAPPPAPPPQQATTPPPPAPPVVVSDPPPQPVVETKPKHTTKPATKPTTTKPATTTTTTKPTGTGKGSGSAQKPILIETDI
ncbi:MAG TPA: serine/threonine-protein kinase [Kofleriaceae bacterium]|nr:serine/threonine-protein kinase [Kofleriaceae bacterium]